MDCFTYIKAAIKLGNRRFATWLYKGINRLWNANNSLPSADEADKILADFNSDNGAELYLKAAEQDHVRAQFKLSEMYAAGKGVPKDMEKAGYWLEKATQSGYPFPGI